MMWDNECKVLGICSRCSINVVDVFFLQLLVFTCFSPECFFLTLSKFYPSLSVWIYCFIRAFTDISVWYSTFSETAVKTMDVHFLNSFIHLFNKYYWSTYSVPGTVVGAGNTAVNKVLLSLSLHYSRRSGIINKKIFGKSNNDKCYEEK